MILINALVSSPDDLDFRLHLRNEFMRDGLMDILDVSRATSAQLNTSECSTSNEGCEMYFFLVRSVICLSICIVLLEAEASM